MTETIHTPGGKQSGTGEPRLYYLDSLRGLAALLVAYAHLGAELREQIPGTFSKFGSVALHLLLDVVDVGKIGVVLFFAISGFIVPISLLGPRRGPPLPVRFVVGRFFRLFPLYWLSIPLALWLPWPALDQEYNALTVAANVTMIQGFLGFDDIIGAYWTLQIELVFYVCCLALALGGWLSRPRAQFGAFLGALALALALAAARFVLNKKLPVALPLALAVMFFGCLWRSRILAGDPAARRLVPAAFMAFALVLPPICILAYSSDHGYNETWERYLLSYTVALALFILGTTRLRVASPYLVRLGVVSYSVYLLHQVVFAAVERVGFHPAHLPAVGGHVYIACVLLLAVAVGEVAYRTVEATSLAFGRRLNARLARMWPGDASGPAVRGPGAAVPDRSTHAP